MHSPHKLGAVLEKCRDPIFGLPIDVVLAEFIKRLVKLCHRRKEREREKKCL